MRLGARFFYSADDIRDDSHDGETERGRRAPRHAARAKFSGIGKQSAASLNSSGKVAYLSAAIVVAVCEDRRLPAFSSCAFGARGVAAPLTSFLSRRSLARIPLPS
jgi:hypothetical protein